MNLRTIREYIKTKVLAVAPSGAIVYSDGDVSKPDLLEMRARVKVLPAETTKISLGLNGHKQGEGLVVIDLFTAKANGYEQLEDFGMDIVKNFNFATQDLGDGVQIHIWSVWVDQLIDENPYFHIPVFVRWTLIHT